MFGYMGEILRVDLSNSRVSTEGLAEDACKLFLGGCGLATRYLFDEVPQGADPLGAENRLIFMTGPLTGTESPSAGRYSIVAKSPLTAAWGHANSGGNWGARPPEVVIHPMEDWQFSCSPGVPPDCPRV
ncbi:hypothetical protein M1O50_03510 [Dehalococcoidia bacterium]|nr:hypothetical protein [Dehalococcoidia bacterium]